MFAGFHFEILQKYRIFSNKCPGAHLMSKLYIPWDRGQIGMKLKTKHVIYQKLATFCKKRYLFEQACKHYLCHVSQYFTDQNIIQREDLMKLISEGLEM